MLLLFPNFCLKLGIFPDCLKIAKAIPNFKSGNKCDTTNYRPISILSSISKILEKIIYSRTTAFFEKHSVFLPTQFGFRPKHSTSHALLDVVTSSFDNINKNNYTALMFIDLKKAFDTVNCDILLNKLEHYGVRGVMLSLFSSFLHDRSQYVSINNSISCKQNISCGVPQGSVLGPFLFTLYINDIVSISSINPRLFADDTCLILNDKKLENFRAGND